MRKSNVSPGQRIGFVDSIHLQVGKNPMKKVVMRWKTHRTHVHIPAKKMSTYLHHDFKSSIHDNHLNVYLNIFISASTLPSIVIMCEHSTAHPLTTLQHCHSEEEKLHCQVYSQMENKYLPPLTHSAPKEFAPVPSLKQKQCRSKTSNTSADNHKMLLGNLPLVCRSLSLIRNRTRVAKCHR